MTPREQHLIIRRAAGLFDFSFMGLYEFPGEKELRELQTRKLQDLVTGQIAYTLLLNDDGSVFNDATVWQMRDGRYWLFTGRRSDYERFRGVARDRSGEYTVLALQGPASGAILSRLVGRDIVLALKYFHFTKNDGLVIARLGYSGELGYELMVPAAQGGRLRQALLERGVPECSFAAADSLRIEAGYVLFDREIDGQANPSELGLERLVGRRFEMKKKLVGLEIQDRPAGAELPLAQVTSECISPSLGKAIALGFAARDTAIIGEPVRLADGRLARVAGLPFYDPERRLPRAAPL